MGEVHDNYSLYFIVGIANDKSRDVLDLSGGWDRNCGLQTTNTKYKTNVCRLMFWVSIISTFKIDGGLKIDAENYCNFRINFFFGRGYNSQLRSFKLNSIFMQTKLLHILQSITHLGRSITKTQMISITQTSADIN